LIAFTDKDGIEWDVIVGRESWGTTVAMFVPRVGDAGPRQSILDTVSPEEGLKRLKSMTLQELQDLLDRATLKPME
jgi:hypothetical protein